MPLMASSAASAACWPPSATTCCPAWKRCEGLLAGGKRLRPAFCYWGWRAAGGEDCPEIYAAAASLELLQASALIHDDVMDASDTRRGAPAVHRQFAARQAGRAALRIAPSNSGSEPRS